MKFIPHQFIPSWGCAPRLISTSILPAGPVISASTCWVTLGRTCSLWPRMAQGAGRMFGWPWPSTHKDCFQNRGGLRSWEAHLTGKAPQICFKPPGIPIEQILPWCPPGKPWLLRRGMWAPSSGNLPSRSSQCLLEPTCRNFGARGSGSERCGVGRQKETLALSRNSYTVVKTKAWGLTWASSTAKSHALPGTACESGDSKVWGWRPCVPRIHQCLSPCPALSPHHSSLCGLTWTPMQWPRTVPVPYTNS